MYLLVQMPFACPLPSYILHLIGVESLCGMDEHVAQPSKKK